MNNYDILSIDKINEKINTKKHFNKNEIIYIIDQSTDFKLATMTIGERFITFEDYLNNTDKLRNVERCEKNFTVVKNICRLLKENHPKSDVLIKIFNVYCSVHNDQNLVAYKWTIENNIPEKLKSTINNIMHNIKPKKTREDILLDELTN